nr:hypothetical protein [Tanacetum cinerariifolium]
MEPEENDGDDEKSEGDSIDYPTTGGDNDANDDGDDLSEDDADDEDEEESSDSEEEEEEHLAPTVPAPALYKVEILLAIPTPPLSPVSLTSYTLPPLLMPLPIFTPLPTSSFPLPLSIPSTSGSESIPEVDIPLRKRARFTTPTSRYEIGESSVAAAAARQIRPTLTIADKRRADDKLIGRLRRERRYFRTLATTYAKEKMEPKRARTTRANPDPTRTTTATEPMTQEAINNLIAQRVADALAEYEIPRNSVVNGDISNTAGIGPRTVRPTRECTYKDYLNCGPLKFNGTEGIIGLTRWFERTESVFSISNCIAETHVKFASCTLIGSALTWWNSQMRAVGQEVTYAMPWKTLKQMMIVKYCPRSEVKKLEVELWNLKVKGTDITSYTLRFQELSLLCGRMFLEESDKTERYVGGLPEMIRGNAYAAGSREKPYRGIKPLCPKCNFYHDGPCRPKCTNCKKTGHLTRDCKSRAVNNNNNNNNQRATTAYQGVPTCFECGAQGHYKRNCPRLGNRNQGNQNLAGNENAVARAYAVGTAGRNPDANVVTGTFLLNNHCDSILFDTGVDKSFVSTAFSSLININPSTLDYSYDVELADGQIIRVNTIIRGCTLNLLNRPFNIDLMPVELGSFDVIVGMDWLKTYHAVIVCDEKIVCVPFEDETLIIRCDGSNNENQLNLISCTKTRKYLLKGYHVFSANITTKTIKDKSKEKQ